MGYHEASTECVGQREQDVVRLRLARYIYCLHCVPQTFDGIVQRLDGPSFIEFAIDGPLQVYKSADGKICRYVRGEEFTAEDNHLLDISCPIPSFQQNLNSQCLDK